MRRHFVSFCFVACQLVRSCFVFFFWFLFLFFCFQPFGPFFFQMSPFYFFFISSYNFFFVLFPRVRSRRISLRTLSLNRQNQRKNEIKLFQNCFTEFPPRSRHIWVLPSFTGFYYGDMVVVPSFTEFT